ncbi:divalent metal cation transporter [Pseudonocardia nigra]|uniref:divalent metal cation transporter n=1 Tax=Pseudonocardia nigra TaxID=1921578 RepID=UPI0027E29573|nr:divalent metal cation transporter [Pseudonocardia nigra]
MDVPAAAAGLLPAFAGTDSILLTTGILGATVMTHVIYLHSGLTQNRGPVAAAAGRRRQGATSGSA